MKNIQPKSVLETLILELPNILNLHPTTTKAYQLIHHIARGETTRLFSDKSTEFKPFEPFGQIAFPYFEMGAINSLDLFGLDELIIFSFYWANRHRYQKVLDIGGNIGLHSIIMSRCGYNVQVFEPDPIHCEKLNENLRRNKCNNVSLCQAAVSTSPGKAKFVRVLGNTTSSHLKGAKNPYGQLETFEVELVDFLELMKTADLIKMDVEGHEKELILATDEEDWLTVDALIEVGSEENARAIYDHLRNIRLNCFAQKKGWGKVESLSDIPTSHREGTLFITQKSTMHWSSNPDSIVQEECTTQCCS